MRIRLDVAYLGTEFEGWQAQETLRDGVAPRTVQGVLTEALSRVHGVQLRPEGAGRTDSGVHAENQVAHVDMPEGAPRIPAVGLRRALNSVLPEDVRVTATSVVAPDWHARFSAAGKVYRYRLRQGDFLPPYAGLIEALAVESLDVAAMRLAAARLTGRHDFVRFSLTGSEPSSTTRLLSRLEVEEEGPVVVFTATGEGFLRGMVRRLVGTLREVGRGRVSPEEVWEHPGPTAEARGLTLVRVLYPPEGLE